MSERFVAKSLIETKASGDRRNLELTFVDATGAKRTLSLPRGMAADLVPVLASLSADMSATGELKFTKTPKHCQVGRARHQRLVLIKFDDDPPYALDVEEAENLCRDLREEAESASSIQEPRLQ
jgi:hypothetical protein